MKPKSFGRRLLLALASVLALSLARAATAQPSWGDPEADVDALFELLSQRLALMPEVAAAKWKMKQPISDPAREQALLDGSDTASRAAGLEPDPVRALLSLQMQWARTLQAQAFDRWSRGDAPPPARELKSALR
ncbi:MAG TPA: chorismate mutase, partial [Polyangiales bacterium]